MRVKSLKIGDSIRMELAPKDTPEGQDERVVNLYYDEQKKKNRKATMANFVTKAAIFDVLWNEANRLILRDNPCQFKDGKCRMGEIKCISISRYVIPIKEDENG